MNNVDPKTPSVYTARLTVSNYAFPSVDGTVGQALLTDGAGTLSFGSSVNLSGIINGTGTNDRIVRWDVSNNVQSSTVALSDTGDLSGVSSLNVAGIVYPTVDSSLNYALLTNGAGTLSFGSVFDVSGAIKGAGTNHHLVRWDVSNNVQSSAVALNDAGDLSGLSSLNVASITYPTTDGIPTQAVITNGTGSLTFGSVVDVSGIITGTGINDRLVRWDVSNNVQSSTVALSDAGDLSGVSSLNVASIAYPTTDGSPNQALLTNGAGTLSFVSVGDVSGVINGAGTDHRLVRWDVSNNLQSSPVALSDAGDLSGILSMNVASITYPTTDGISNQALLTDGAGTLSFGNIVDVSGIISGTGTNNHLARWDVSNNIQNSTIALNDSGDLSGGTRLNFNDNTQIATSSLYFDFSNTATVFAGTTDCCGSLLYLGLVGACTACTMNDASQTTMLCSKLSNMTNSVNSIVTGSDSCSMTNNSSFCGIQNSISSTITNSTNSYIMCSTSSSIANTSFMGISTTSESFSDSNNCSIESSRNSTMIDTTFSSIVGCDNVYFNAMDYGLMFNSIRCSLSSTPGNGYTGIIASNSCGIIRGLCMSQMTSTDCAVFIGSFSTVFGSESCYFERPTRTTYIGCNQCSIDASNSDPFRNTAFSALNVGLSSAQTAVTNDSVWGGVTNRTWLIDSNTGTYYGLVGAIDTAVPDFAEYFENMYTEIIPFGTIVTLDQGRVRAALSNEFILGIVSAQPGLVAGGCDMSWQGTWKKDEWGRYETQTIIEPSWTPGPGQTMADAPTFTTMVPNQEYDPTLPYQSRKERPTEWTIVGLMGQVSTMVDANVVPNDFIAPGVGGIATTSIAATNIICMRINSPFNEQRGYAIALCFIF